MEQHMERTMRQSANNSGAWRLWAGWGLAFLGFPLGGLAGLGAAGAVVGIPQALVGGAATGAVIGLAQWLVLRRRLPLSAWWVAATALGMAAGLALGVGALGTSTVGAALPLRGLVTGAAIGIAQYALLRQIAARAAIWPLAVALGWALGWAITRAAGVDLTPGFTVFGSTGAWAFQLLSGLALAWMMRSAPR